MSFKDYLKKKLNEGKYDNTNLADPNSYYKVIDSFDVFVKTGSSHANTYYGSGEILKSVWKKMSAEPGYEIHNLMGGTYIIPTDTDDLVAWKVLIKEPEFAPFVKKYYPDQQVFPLDKLEQISKEEALSGVDYIDKMEITK